MSHDGFVLTLDPATSARLGRIRQSSTEPEIAVRRVVSALGLRYRVKNRDLPGSPDLANRRNRWAIFVHGCFWHRHEGCARTTTPKRNREFWIAKFQANRQRDARAIEALLQRGYRVHVVWECETYSPLKLARRLRSLRSEGTDSRRPGRRA